MSLMSGAVSIPLAFFALFSSEQHPKWWFALLAIVALWFCLIRMAYKNYPKFKLSCSMDIERCATPKDAHEIKFFRMLVETKCINGIEHCSGNLAKIEKDGDVVFKDDATVLPFAKAEDPDCLSKLILPERNYWLDILAVYVHHMTRTEYELFCSNPNLVAAKNDVVIFSTRPHSVANDLNGNYIFEKIGEYILYVNVSGKGVPTAKAQLKFNWTGKANTSTIERMK